MQVDGPTRIRGRSNLAAMAVRVGMWLCGVVAVMWIGSILLVVDVYLGVVGVTFRHGGVTVMRLSGLPWQHRGSTIPVQRLAWQVESAQGLAWSYRCGLKRPWVQWYRELGLYKGWTLIGIPCWTPMLIVVIPTGLLWFWSRRRQQPGCCPYCGYDLRGAVSGRCSECGRETPTG